MQGPRRTPGLICEMLSGCQTGGHEFPSHGEMEGTRIAAIRTCAVEVCPHDEVVDLRGVHSSRQGARIEVALRVEFHARQVEVALDGGGLCRREPEADQTTQRIGSSFAPERPTTRPDGDSQLTSPLVALWKSPGGTRSSGTLRSARAGQVG